VTYDHRSYHEHEMSEESLMFEIGADIYVVDAGWFGNRGSNCHGRGLECGDHLPAGLEPVFRYGRKKGLLCGLWVDADRIGSEA